MNYLNYRKQIEVKPTSLINSPNLNNKTYSFTSFLSFSQLNQSKLQFIKIFNFYKIGLLLGFFIDAFKVGS